MFAYDDTSAVLAFINKQHCQQSPQHRSTRLGSVFQKRALCRPFRILQRLDAFKYAVFKWAPDDTLRLLSSERMSCMLDRALETSRCRDHGERGPRRERHNASPRRNRRRGENYGWDPRDQNGRSDRRGDRRLAQADRDDERHGDKRKKRRRAQDDSRAGRPLRDETNGYDCDTRSQQRDLWGQTTDPRLDAQRIKDPRADGALGKAQKAMLGLGIPTGRNTDSFDPRSTLVRPMMRVRMGDAKAAQFGQMLKHDDVVIVPEFFCAKEDWSLYYKLVEDMLQAQGEKKPQADFISWHEGAHLISKRPTGDTYMQIQRRMGDYFGLRPDSRGTRFNWYKDATDWKPMHHDSVAGGVLGACRSYDDAAIPP